MVDMKRYLLLLLFACTACLWQVADASASRALDDDLLYECTLGSTQEVQRLLKQGASPNATNPDGWTALALAANRIDDDALPIVTLLVEAGANVNGGKRGYYPVINAAKNSQVKVVEYLMDYGADPRSLDAEGHSLVWISEQVREPELVALMEKTFMRERAQEKALRSEENLKKLVRDYSYALCESKYWSYYLASKQDPETNKSALRARIQERMQDARHSNQLLYRYFPHMDKQGFSLVSTQSQKIVQRQLDNLVSNRNRKEQGVGTLEDMDRRCSKIANRWKVSLTTIEDN